MDRVGPHCPMFHDVPRPLLPIIRSPPIVVLQMTSRAERVGRAANAEGVDVALDWTLIGPLRE